MKNKHYETILPAMHSSIYFGLVVVFTMCVLVEVLALDIALHCI